MVRVLVTGGAGYIGSHAVRLLARAGHEVWVYDNLSRGHAAAVPAGRLIEGELADTARLTQLMADQRIEAVVHFAALSLVGESVANPQLYYQNNVVGSLSLFAAMRAAGVWQIVFSSTTATYGVPARVPIGEDEPQCPVNPYGTSKWIVERALADYARAYDWGYAALRYFNAAGATPDGDLGEDHQPETRLIPLALQTALGRRQEVAIFGDDYPTPDGTCIRDYVHVDDLAQAHRLVLERLTPGCQWKLNLGIGRGYSVREVLDVCRKVSGRPIPERIAPRRAGDPPVLVADATRAHEQLGWQPHYRDLESIVATAWNWHRTHPEGYGGVARGE